MVFAPVWIENLIFPWYVCTAFWMQNLIFPILPVLPIGPHPPSSTGGSGEPWPWGGGGPRTWNTHTHIYIYIYICVYNIYICDIYLSCRMLTFCSPHPWWMVEPTMHFWCFFRENGQCFNGPSRKKRLLTHKKSVLKLCSASKCSCFAPQCCTLSWLSWLSENFWYELNRNIQYDIDWYSPKKTRNTCGYFTWTKPSYQTYIFSVAFHHGCSVAWPPWTAHFECRCRLVPWASLSSRTLPTNYELTMDKYDDIYNDMIFIMIVMFIMILMWSWYL